ncbi:MAG: dehydrogenase, partial [Eggerthellaceae bacterium]|nr:dehydrogenase [Eggerthellaceae bacterium]
VFHEYPACPPVGESLDDFYCVAAVAKKIDELLGNENQDVYMAYTGNDTSTQRCVELFWQGSGVAHLDVNDDFHNKDIFVLPCDPDIQDFKLHPPGLRTFYEDPENHPLTTPTGKLEFTSTKLKEYFPDDPERPPFPKWIETSENHDERLSSKRAEKYPLLCMSNHGRWRFHANLDDITWNREVETMKIRAKDGYQYEPAWLHPETAKARGIQHGDIVKVYNERGVVLAGAKISERIQPQSVMVNKGSRSDPIAPGFDRGGNINLISPAGPISKHCYSFAVSGYLVAVEKVTKEEMDGWVKQYPEAFERAYDPASGSHYAGWVEGVE